MPLRGADAPPAPEAGPVVQVTLPALADARVEVTLG
jgi:hypothetical protein